MKAYLITFAISWAAITGTFVCCIALAIGLLSFLFWHIPAGIAYLALLRTAVAGGFVTTLFFMPSKEGKASVADTKDFFK